MANMPQSVTTLRDLEALPEGSVVTRNDVPYLLTGKGWEIVGGAYRHTYSAESLLLNNNATLIKMGPTP